MRETPGNMHVSVVMDMDQGVLPTFCAPILVDGENEDAFRRDVAEIGRYSEDLDLLLVVLPRRLTPAVHPHIRSRPSWMVFRRSRQRLEWMLCRGRLGVPIIASR